MYKMPYRSSVSPYQFPTSGQSWGQSPQGRVIGASVVSAGTSNSAGSANRVYSYLKHKKGNEFALNYFNKTIFGPYSLNRSGTALIWN